MGKEIERKFLIDTSLLPIMEVGIAIKQGYLTNSNGITTRVRLQKTITDTHSAFITIKGPTDGITRSEFEYRIPQKDAEEMLNMCQATISKSRTKIDRFEIDQFYADNKGLFIAEIELESEDEFFERPEWLGEEVSDDPRYYNSNLVDKPYTTW